MNMFNLPLLLTWISIIGLVCNTDIYGNKGSTVILKSDLRDPTETGSPFISWRNVDNGKIYSDGTSVASYPETQGRLSVVGDHSAGEFFLQISNITEFDVGKYSSSINIGGVIYTTYVNLYLTVPPFNVSIQNMTLQYRVLGTEGQDLAVLCVAVGGKPPPSVTLTIGGTILATSKQSVTYILTSISKSYDRKTITCQATNEANVNNPHSDSAMLYLNLKPLPPTFSQTSLILEETKPLVVSCTSTGSRPQAILQWTIALTNVTPSSTTQTTITTDDTFTVTSTLRRNVDRAFNGQTITCIAVNIAAPYGVQISKTLDVKFTPDITVNNATFSQNTGTRIITCIPVGNPSTYTFYKWLHKSRYKELIRELDGGQNGILTLPSVPVEARYQDSGEYVCTASNGIIGRDGMIQQTGSGYVTTVAQPVFTSDNNDIKYGELGKDVDINVYVYSVPKYLVVRWFKTNTQISRSEKYILSELVAVVADKFHGTTIQLDGYKVTLTIRTLVESDFDVSYRVELLNDVSQAVAYTTLLILASSPQTPSNFTVLISSDSHIALQWEAIYNVGHEQTFYVEYRVSGSNTWKTEKVPDSIQTGRQIYILAGLQDATLYELRMYAENKFNKSLPTETVTIKTIKADKFSSSVAVIGGVAGGLSAVIVIMIIINITLLILWKRGTRKQKSKSQTSRWKDEISYYNPMDCKEKDEQDDTHGKRYKFEPKSAQEYETLDMKDIPSTYSELQVKIKKNPSSEYETLGMTDSPNAYSELNSEQDRRQSKTAADHYKSLSDKANSAMYEETTFQQGR